MLNEKKIRLMSKLAVFEEKEGKEELQLSHYYRTDYVRFQVLKTVICVTIAFFVILGLIIFYHSEYLIAEAVKLDYEKIGMYTLGAYIITLTIYILSTMVGFSLKYNASKKRLNRYLKNLKILRNFYKEENQDSK